MLEGVIIVIEAVLMLAFTFGVIALFYVCS